MRWAPETTVNSNKQPTANRPKKISGGSSSYDNGYKCSHYEPICKSGWGNSCFGNCYDDHCWKCQRGRAFEIWGSKSKKSTVGGATKMAAPVGGAIVMRKSIWD